MTPPPPDALFTPHSSPKTQTRRSMAACACYTRLIRQAAVAEGSRAGLTSRALGTGVHWTPAASRHQRRHQLAGHDRQGRRSLQALGQRPGGKGRARGVAGLHAATATQALEEAPQRGGAKGGHQPVRGVAGDDCGRQAGPPGEAGVGEGGQAVGEEGAKAGGGDVEGRQPGQPRARREQVRGRQEGGGCRPGGGGGMVRRQGGAGPGGRQADAAGAGGGRWSRSRSRAQRGGAPTTEAMRS